MIALAVLMILLKLFNDNNINIKDSFGFVLESQKYAILCIEVDNLENAEKLLSKSKYKPLAEKDLYSL